MFIWEKVSPDVVSMCALFLLLVVPFNGHAILLPVDKAQKASIMAGIFGNNAVLTVAFMFIVGTALERTGLAEGFGRWFEKIAGRREWQAMLALAGVTIGLHFFINNTTVAATDGTYHGRQIYQALAPDATFSGAAFSTGNAEPKYPILGVWMIDQECAGMGIRESNTPITDNLSSFVPHFFL